MIKFIPPKDLTYKKCFALLPKRIGDYRVWLSYYYKTWDRTRQGDYFPHFFVYEEDIIKHMEQKRIAKNIAALASMEYKSV